MNAQPPTLAERMQLDWGPLTQTLATIIVEEGHAKTLDEALRLWKTDAWRTARETQFFLWGRTLLRAARSEGVPGALSCYASPAEGTDPQELTRGGPRLIIAFHAGPALDVVVFNKAIAPHEIRYGDPGPERPLRTHVNRLLSAVRAAREKASALPARVPRARARRSLR